MLCFLDARSTPFSGWSPRGWRCWTNCLRSLQRGRAFLSCALPALRHCSRGMVGHTWQAGNPFSPGSSKSMKHSLIHSGFMPMHACTIDCGHTTTSCPCSLAACPCYARPCELHALQAHRTDQHNEHVLVHSLGWTDTPLPDRYLSRCFLIVAGCRNAQAHC